MSIPKVCIKGNGFLFDWEKEKLQCLVNRVHAHTDGRVTCNLTFTTTDTEYESKHLLQTSFNLSAMRSRNDLAKTLAERYKEPVEWDALIENLCVQSMRRSEEGAPVVQLEADGKTPGKRPEYLIYPVIPKYKPTIFFGDSSSYKSSLCKLFALLISLHWDDNAFGFDVNGHETVLLLDWEAEEDEALSSWQSIVNGSGLRRACKLNYRNCYLPLSADIESISAKVDDIAATTIIIDSLGPAAGGDLNTTPSSIGFYNALRSLKTQAGKPVTSIIIAHNAKNPLEKKKSIYGNAFFGNISRYTWEVTKVQDTSSDDADICLYHRKTNISALQKPISFHVHHNGTGTVFTRQDISAIGEFTAKLSIPEQILIILRRGNQNAAQLASEVGVDMEDKSEKSTFYSALKRLRDKENIIHLKDDTYGLRSYD